MARDLIMCAIGASIVLLVGAAQSQGPSDFALTGLPDGRVVIANGRTGEVCRLPAGSWDIDEERHKAMVEFLNEDPNFSPLAARAYSWREGLGVECIADAIWLDE